MTALDRARAAWGATLPGWVKALAEACDKASLRAVSRKLGISPASISLAVNARRGNGCEFVKDKVESELMAGIVPCPVLGVIGKAECLEEQRQPFSAANQIRLAVSAACKHCEHREGK